MQIAVVGLGKIAEKAYLPILCNRAELKVVVTSRTPERIDKTIERYPQFGHVRNTNDLLKINPKAAFVLTPKETHYEICKQLLEANIDVYVEKPATIQSSEFSELIELAESRGRVFMVGFNRRFAPIHAKAKDIVKGITISSAVIQKSRVSPYYTDLRDMLFEDSIHQVDILRFFCGEAEMISGVCLTKGNQILNTIFTFSLENGGNAVFIFTMQSGSWSESYTIHGPDASINVNAFSSLKVITPTQESSWAESYASGWKTTLEGRGFTQEINEFISCIRNRNEPQHSAKDILKTHILVEEMINKTIIHSLD